MSDVTRILSAIKQGDPHGAEQLLPLVYDELRRLAAGKMAQEAPGQTLQATALVHEAYLRLIGSETPSWSGRGHFFSAAAEAIPRPLLDQLAEGGRLVIPVARSSNEPQDLLLITKRGDRLETTTLFKVLFVPLVEGTA